MVCKGTGGLEQVVGIEGLGRVFVLFFGTALCRAQPCTVPATDTALVCRRYSHDVIAGMSERPALVDSYKQSKQSDCSCCTEMKAKGRYRFYSWVPVHWHCVCIDLGGRGLT
jgi:hypothetical protein